MAGFAALPNNSSLPLGHLNKKRGTVKPRALLGRRTFKFSADSLPRCKTTSKLTFVPSGKLE
jgi:hypothetical protein